jgi:hypothetical protein
LFYSSHLISLYKQIKHKFMNSAIQRIAKATTKASPISCPKLIRQNGVHKEEWTNNRNNKKRQSQSNVPFFDNGDGAFLSTATPPRNRSFKKGGFDDDDDVSDWD